MKKTNCQSKSISRRKFLQSVVATTVALPLLVNINTKSAKADTPKKPVELNDPMAKTLGYVEDVSKIDKSASPKYVSGQNCSNCVLYMEGGQKLDGFSGEWGKCGLFTGGLVAANGWCNSYAPKIA